MFFFEKKNQKTFPGCFARVAPGAAAMPAALEWVALAVGSLQRIKVFCFFLQKRSASFSFL